MHLRTEKNYLPAGSTHVNLNYKHLCRSNIFQNFLQQKNEITFLKKELRYSTEHELQNKKSIQENVKFQIG